jgi:hypothetical protein
MDYRRGMGEFRALLQEREPDSLEEFSVLEARFWSILKDEQRYGSSEVNRSERAFVIHSLNRLALDTIGVSFNDLCAGVSTSPSSIAATDASIAVGGDVTQVSGDADIIGAVSGSTVVTAGRDVIIHYRDPNTSLISLLGSLRREIASQAPAGEKIDALEQVEELEHALQSDQTDFYVFSRIQEWFKKRLPELAGALTSILLHPAVREAVKKQQEVLEDELELHHRNLHKLEERVALYGPAEAPLHLLNQIETERKRIQELESLIKQVNENVED